MVILIRATWDDEAKVWVAESPDLPGLVTEAESLNDLDAKLPGLIHDLLDSDDGPDGLEIPVEVVASYSSRVRLSA